MGTVIHAVTAWIVNGVSSLGYYGIILMMGIESACIPLPSEIIMPFGGYLVYTEPDKYNVWMMGLAGALGCVWGSTVAYWAGKYGGRPFIEKYGRYILVRRKDLDRADKWFEKHGMSAVFFSRLLPVIRTFISFPAGMARVNFGQFVFYTFVGSFPWCLGEKWDTELKRYFHGADAVIGIVLLLLAGLYIYHHVRSDREYRAAKQEAE